MQEIFRETECGMYEISNYYNIRTTSYRFYKGTELIQSQNKPITITDTRKLKERSVTILHAGFGFSPTRIYKKASKVFTDDELNIVKNER